MTLPIFNPIRDIQSGDCDQDGWRCCSWPWTLPSSSLPCLLAPSFGLGLDVVHLGLNAVHLCVLCHPLGGLLLGWEYVLDCGDMKCKQLHQETSQ